MEVRELKTLLALMQDFGLVELEIEDKKGKVRLVRAGAAAHAIAPLPAVAPTRRPDPYAPSVEGKEGSRAIGQRCARRGTPVLTEIKSSSRVRWWGRSTAPPHPIRNLSSKKAIRFARARPYASLKR